MFTATRDGLPGKPIVIRGAGGTLFDGISLQGRKHVYLENLISINTIDLFDAEDCAVKRCRVFAVFGIISASGGLGRWAPDVEARLAARPDNAPLPHARNCYIADNIVVGVCAWENDAMGARGRNMGEGIQITGPGNVICYNRVTGFRDCISTMEDRSAVDQQCIDIYNNDIYLGVDDGIEADFCMGNCRILRNRITNCFMGLSSQPGLGGPTYFIRNIMYNLTGAPYKLNRNSVGDVILHNTVVKTGDGASCSTSAVWKHAYFRNNIGIGGGLVRRYGAYSNGRGLAANFPAAHATCDFDYNGYGTVGLPFQGNIAGRLFDSLETLRTQTAERHGVQVDMNIFAHDPPFPNPGIEEWPVADLRLRAGSAAMDAGEVIPNINDGFTGRAPDLGACEVGQAVPIYGPRPVEDEK